MKKNNFSFEFKSIVIALLTLAMVAATGTFAYLRISEVISEINTVPSYDSKLLAAESLLKNLIRAENSAKSYSLTEDTIHLIQFYENTNQAMISLDELIEKAPRYATSNAKLDSLDSLVGEKFRILNQLLVLQDPYRVQEALNKVTAEIEASITKENTQKLEAKKKPLEPDSQKFIFNIPKRKINDTLVKPIEKKKKKRRFFDWLFKKKEDEKAVVDTVIKPIKIITKAPIDTIKQLRPKEKTSSSIKHDTTADVLLDEISKEVKKVKKEEKGIERHLKGNELDLIITDRKITLEIQRILDQIKTNELTRLSKNNNEIEERVKATNRQIVYFSIALFALLIAMGFVLINYLRNQKTYRKAMKNARRKAEEFAASKSRFLANMSHEIRTPMNSIIGFSEQLTKSDVSAKQNEQLQIITQSAHHLLHIINDVLDFSKLENQKLPLEKKSFSVTQLVEECILSMKPLLNNKEVKLFSNFSTTIPSLVIGDSYRLKQILLNLISNSIKFTEKGTIEVQLSAEKITEDNFLLTFKVIDSGIGIKKSQGKRVLKEFEQAEKSTSKNYGGTGLGLSITNRLVKLHGGKMKIESNFKKGTIITLQIPFTKGNINHIDEETNKTLPENFIKNLKFLIADDEVFNRKLISTILTKHRASYTEVENGLEVLEEIKKEQYDLILMDAQMPKLNGINATKKIREMKMTTPILVISAAILEEERAKYEKSGMNHFLSKPFKEVDLIEAIIFTLKITNSE